VAVRRWLAEVFLQRPGSYSIQAIAGFLMTMPSLPPISSLLPYLLPPLIGALIGYFTNAVAIRMLFRPLTKKSIFGIRVPFTPGVIPRQRKILAQSIAGMVSRRLLTEEVLVAQVRSERFVTGIENAVSGYTAHILNFVPSSDISGEPGSFLARLEDVLQTMLELFAASSVFDKTLKAGAEHLVGMMYQLKISSIVPDVNSVADLVEHLYDRFRESNTTAWIEVRIKDCLLKAIREERTVGSFIGPEFAAAVRNTGDHIYDPLTARGVEWLRTPEMRDELSRRGRVILSRILDRLSSVQRFFVVAGQYEKGLKEQMPAIIDDLVNQLERTLAKKDVREKVLTLVSGSVDEMRNEKLGDILLRYNVEPAVFSRGICTGIRRVLDNQDVRVSMRNSTIRWLNEHGADRFSDILEGKARLSRNVVAAALFTMVHRTMSNPEMPRSVAAGAVSSLRNYLHNANAVSLGVLSGIHDEDKRRLDSAVARRILRLIESRLPEIIAAVDFHTLVVQKIDSLDVAEVEGLLLMVIARHLRWINVFGGILGLLIGASQVVLSVLL
jgi:uncharacterized membrane protein YheB (UPF0754 family)